MRLVSIILSIEKKTIHSSVVLLINPLELWTSEGELDFNWNQEQCDIERFLLDYSSIAWELLDSNEIAIPAYNSVIFFTQSLVLALELSLVALVYKTLFIAELMICKWSYIILMSSR